MSLVEQGLEHRLVTIVIYGGADNFSPGYAITQEDMYQLEGLI